MPTQCPGVRMSSSQSDSVYNGEQDFRRGQWVSEMSYYCPGGYFQALTEEEKRSIKGDSECPDNTPPTT